MGDIPKRPYPKAKPIDYGETQDPCSRECTSCGELLRPYAEGPICGNCKDTDRNEKLKETIRDRELRIEVLTIALKKAIHGLDCVYVPHAQCILEAKAALYEVSLESLKPNFPNIF